MPRKTAPRREAGLPSAIDTTAKLRRDAAANQAKDTAMGNDLRRNGATGIFDQAGNEIYARTIEERAAYGLAPLGDGMPSKLSPAERALLESIPDDADPYRQ